MFIVDDNFIGNKARAKELLRAMAEWREETGARFDFITEASLNLADDVELMQLMKDAGFKSVFLGVETPDESGLIASNKLQNTRRSLLDSVATIQSYGMQVMGGFILGFDTDKEDIFDRMVEFIQKSGIPIAMVGLLQAMPGTQLFRRLRQRGPDCGRGRRQQHVLRPAELSAAHGFGEAGGGLPRGDEEDLQLRGLLRAGEALPESGASQAGEACGGRAREEACEVRRCLTRDNMRALVNSIVRQGVFGRHQWSYWKFLASAATKYRRCFGAAMTLAVMGYHFQVMTRKLGKAMDKATKAARDGRSAGSASEQRIEGARRRLSRRAQPRNLYLLGHARTTTTEIRTSRRANGSARRRVRRRLFAWPTCASAWKKAAKPDGRCA